MLPAPIARISGITAWIHNQTPCNPTSTLGLKSLATIASIGQMAELLKPEVPRRLSLPSPPFRGRPFLE